MSELERIAEAAYIYLYPLVLMDETRRQQCTAFNTWFHSRKYPPGHFKMIIRPNFDTLYSIAWLDLTTGPVVIHTPNTNGRYYCMHMMTCGQILLRCQGPELGGQKQILA